MKTHPVRVAIIGCGEVAPIHMKGFQGAENVQITWLCDIQENKARALAERSGVAQIATDYRSLLEADDVDAISICTDHASHATIAIDALKSGRHVLCEKALAPTAAAMTAMLAAHARYPDLVFSGVFQHRFDPAYRGLKKLVDEGQLGPLITVGAQLRCQRAAAYYQADAWRGTWAKEGGSVLINQAIHLIDLLSWISGGIQSVCGAYANLTHRDVIETEDTAVASLRFANGALGTLEASSSSHIKWEPTLYVQGEKGTVEIRHDRPLRVQCEDPEQAHAWESLLTEIAPEDDIIPRKAYYGAGHARQIADFVSAIREQRAPFVTAASARSAVDTILAIYESHRQGGWIPLP